MKNFRKVISFLIILSLIFFIAGTVSAVTRGIHVVSKKGKTLYLYKDYHALVIGISKYDHWPNLPNAVKDARQVAAKLKEKGFTVKLITDPDARQLKKAMANLSRTTGKEKNRALFLYFAGHGETSRLIDGTDLGYIIPSDCPLQNIDPEGFDGKAVSMNEIEMLALKVKSKHMLMVFDSCFSGSLFALTRAAPAEITEKSARMVRQFITAGGADESVLDQSVFKVCLLQGLDGEADFNKDNYVTGSELGMYLQTKVVNYSNGTQHPQYGKINNPYLDKGDFIFQLGKIEDTTTSSSDEVSEQRLVEERASIERQRRKLQELKALAKERGKLKAERKRLAAVEKKDSQSVDSIIDRRLNNALEGAASILDEMKALVKDENKY